MEPEVEVVENALSTDVFTPKHKDISKEFLNRIVGMLALPSVVPKTYAVDCDYHQRESIKVEISEKTTIEINLITRT